MTRFIDDVKEHRLEVLLDDGVYRHLRCRRPGTYCMGFDIVTYPGHLCYSGDMGTYVFSRLPDMFEFFRRPDGRVNYDYWAEKVEAKDKNGGLREFTTQRFAEALREDIDALKEGLDDEERASLEDAISEADLFSDVDRYNAQDAIRRVIEFEWPGRDCPFSDFYEHQLEELTYRFRWCCHALVWAIARYDEGKAVPPIQERAS